MHPDPSEKKRVWQLITLDIARRAEEFAISALFDLGTTGVVTLEESADTTKLGAYFDERADAEEVARSVEAEFARAEQGGSLLGISISPVPDQDWMQKWKEGFEPVVVGQRLVVAPSWKLPRETGARVVIQIDPGMAFGTGTHETTRLCLEAIEDYWRGGRMLDVGTGTGILAIGAALLRPGSRITAVDIDPQAVEVARENVAVNGAVDSVEVLEGQPPDFAGGAFDLVVANLTAEVIVALVGDLVGCLAPSGVLILSGILTSLRPGVELAANEAGLAIVERREAGEWSALAARRGER
ncbi:MAG TPA: 50S ribosomal protein L11 methyltransferase [Blastocatellia bacterium]|jgi:ribosomal protein L11 methyltransferase|nr:50S ribosomal protein L11 methyltransferase [Blastocatellia bacterium]